MSEYSTLDKPKACDFTGCGRKHYANDLCRGHYQQRKRGVELRELTAPRTSGPRKPVESCSFDTCDKPSRVGGLCSGHRNQRDKGRELTPLRPRKTNGTTVLCGFGSCGNDTTGGAHGLCRGHYRQKRLGQELGPLSDWNDNLARNDEGQKRCAICRDWKQLDAFHKSADRPDGLYTRCKPCIREAMLLNTYGVTLARYDELLASQNGGCAICGAFESSDGSSLAVDHDHACCPGSKSCGRCVRGLLCRACNQGLGNYEDSPDRLRVAAVYLEAHSARP